MQDDLEQILGIKYSPEQQEALKELARKANDRLRVKNILDSDYYVEWDKYGSGGRFLVPGAHRDIGYGPGQAVHPRYIAFKFFKEISAIFLSAEMQARIKEENDRRIAAGMKAMDKTFETGEELAFALPYRPDSRDKLLELLPKVILGIEEEYGLDPLPYQPTEDKVKWEEVQAIINRPASQRAQEQLAAQSPVEASPVPPPPLATPSDDEMLKEVAI